VTGLELLALTVPQEWPHRERGPEERKRVRLYQYRLW